MNSENEQEEQKRLKRVEEVHRERIDREIANRDKNLALGMLALDKTHKMINKDLTARVFLFNQDNALKELEKAINLPVKQNAYDNFMKLFVEEQPKCTINELQSFVGYNIVKHWLDNLINEYGETEEETDYKVVMSIIDKYYERFLKETDYE